MIQQSYIRVNDLKVLNLNLNLKDYIKLSAEAYIDEKFYREFELNSLILNFYLALWFLTTSHSRVFFLSHSSFTNSIPDLEFAFLSFEGDYVLNESGSANYSSTNNLVIQIDGTGTPNTFRWSLNNGSTWIETNVPITSGVIRRVSPEGIALYVKFTNTTGHTSGQSFNIKYQPYPRYSEKRFFYINVGSGIDYAGLVVGSSSIPYSIFDVKLGNRILHSTTGLQYGAMSISTPIYSANDGLITITRSFTNSSGSTININELGLAGDILNSTYNIRGLFAKDNVSITLNPSKVLNLTYNFRIQQGANGGFTKNFIEGIYAYFMQTNRTLQDINGGSITFGYNSNLLSFTNFAPSQRNYFDVSLYDVGGYSGIVLGNGTTSPNINDYRLSSIIKHGTSTGRLLYYNALNVSNLQFDFSLNKISFTLDTMFLNKSGSNVSISEVALYSQVSGAGNKVCVARFILPTPVVLSNNQALLVQLTIST